MPVTFTVTSHPAEPFHRQQIQNYGAEIVLQTACPEQWTQCTELLQTSIEGKELPNLVPQGNGFVQAVLTAYKRYHDLIIRPDDVWMSILSQLSFYINAHAEELREYFVVHKGRKTLSVTSIGNRYTVDFGSMARQMTAKIQEQVVDKTLVDWILPNFTTTTVKDTTICAVLMMSSLKSFFDYRMSCICGIPSVTLEGTRADWQALLDRLDRLPELGAEPAVWARMLRPILTRFVAAFDSSPYPNPNSSPDADTEANTDADADANTDSKVNTTATGPDRAFWNAVAHSHERFYGPDDLSGWITAFTVWTAEGKWQGGPLAEVTSPRSLEGLDERQREYVEARRYVLDGIAYPALSMAQIAQGFCEVDVLLDDNGVRFDCMMVAGHVAFAVVPSPGGLRPSLNQTSSPSDSQDTIQSLGQSQSPSQSQGPSQSYSLHPNLSTGPSSSYSSGPRRPRAYDTISPSPQWFMFIKGKRELPQLDPALHTTALYDSPPGRKRRASCWDVVRSGCVIG